MTAFRGRAARKPAARQGGKTADVLAALASVLELVATIFSQPGKDKRERALVILGTPGFGAPELAPLSVTLRDLGMAAATGLDVEYVRLFLHGRPATAHPYESFYRTGLLMDPECLADLDSLFAAAGVRPAEESALPADHVAVELDFLVLLLRGLAGAAPGRAGAETLREIARKLLEEHLMPFSGAFCTVLADLHPAPYFVAAAANLGAALSAARYALASDARPAGDLKSQETRPLTPAGER